MPFTPGGTNDIVARVLSRELSDSMGQQFVVDNRPGASGVVGADIVAKAPADGYTLMVHSVSHLANAHAYKKLPYDTLRDFEPLAALAGQPGALVVHPALPARPLAVTGTQRSNLLPELPTVAEAAIPGYDMNPWTGLFAPAGLARGAADRLVPEVNRVLRRPEFTKLLVEQAVEPWLATQQEFAARVRADYERYAKFYRMLGITAS